MTKLAKRLVWTFMWHWFKRSDDGLDEDAEDACLILHKAISQRIFFLTKRWTEECTGSIIDVDGFDVHLNEVQAVKRSRLLHTSLIFMCSWPLVLLQLSGLGQQARGCSYIYSFGWHFYPQQLHLRQNTVTQLSQRGSDNAGISIDIWMFQLWALNFTH